MKLKLDENGFAVHLEGNPVFVHDDGKEIAFDAKAAVAKISSLNAEAKKRREERDEARDLLKAFDGLEDAETARKAINIVKNLDAKKLIDAGEVEKIKSEAIKAFDERYKGLEEKFAPIVTERDSLKTQLVREKVTNAFARSKMITDKLAIPADMVQSKFGDAFKVEGDHVVAYDATGNKLFSRAKPGEIAGFDEALEIMIDQYPYRDHILKGAGASGGGAQGAGGAGGKRVVTRAQFDAMDPTAKATTAAAAGKGEIALTD